MIFTPAFAQATNGGQGSTVSILFPLLLVFIVMYFFIIRPQQKKFRQHQELINSLRRNDQVVTQGGIIGKIKTVKDNNEIEIEIAENVRVRVVKSMVTSVLDKSDAKEAKTTSATKLENGKKKKTGKSKKNIESTAEANTSQAETGKNKDSNESN